MANLDEKELYAKNVTFGAYKLPEFIIHSISGAEAAPITISDDMLKELDDQVARAVSNYGGNYRSNSVTSKTQTTAKQEVVKNDTTTNDSTKAFVSVETQNKYQARYIHQGEGEIYIGSSPSSPQVGDVRVTFTVVKPHMISLIAKVKGDTFQKYVGKNKKEFTRVENGDVSKEEMFAHQESENNILMWALRIIGIIMIFLGLKGVFGFVVTLAKIIPFVSNILNFGVNIVCGIFAFVWSILIIAIAWLFYRPLIAIPLLLIIIGAIVFFAIRGKKRGAAVPPTPGV